MRENLVSLGVDFPLSNTCQFFRPKRGEEDRKIAAKKRMRRGRVRWRAGEEQRRRGRGIDLTLGESHHNSVHFHSSGLVMGVLIWQVGGEGRRGIREDENILLESSRDYLSPVPTLQPLHHMHVCTAANACVHIHNMLYTGKHSGILLCLDENEEEVRVCIALFCVCVCMCACVPVCVSVQMHSTRREFRHSVSEQLK